MKVREKCYVIFFRFRGRHDSIENKISKVRKRRFENDSERWKYNGLHTIFFFLLFFLGERNIRGRELRKCTLCTRGRDPREREVSLGPRAINWRGGGIGGGDFRGTGSRAFI